MLRRRLFPTLWEMKGYERRVGERLASSTGTTHAGATSASPSVAASTSPLYTSGYRSTALAQSFFLNSNLPHEIHSSPLLSHFRSYHQRAPPTSGKQSMSSRGNKRTAEDLRDASDAHIRFTIGDISVPVPLLPPNPERVPWELPIDNVFSPTSPITKTYLRWMAQKELLHQDICLVGEPGPARRWLAMTYCHYTHREMQLLSLSRDTTESDIKQRREIRNGTLVYEDQPAVTAARQGQILVLEGLEKVERNVLPVINNLLENREMHLDNGQMLIHPDRYDRLLQQQVKKLSGRAKDANAAEDENQSEILYQAHQALENLGLLRVSEKFRVIGLTVPVPQFDGNPLDPPLRSRFQCMYVNAPPTSVFTAPSVDVYAATSAARQEAPAGVKTSEEEIRVGIEALRQADVENVVKLRASIDEVNQATADFNNNAGSGKDGKGSGSTPAPTAPTSNVLAPFGSYELSVLVKQLYLFPDIPVGDMLVRVFPWHLFAQQSASGGGGAFQVEEAQRKLDSYRGILSACNIGVPAIGRLSEYGVDESGQSRSSSNGSGGSGNGGSSPSSRGRGSAPSATARRGSAVKISSKLREAVASLAAFATKGMSSSPSEGTETEKQLNYTLQLRQTQANNNSEYDEELVKTLNVQTGVAVVASSQGALHFPVYLGEEFGKVAEKTAADLAAPNAATTTVVVNDFFKSSSTVLTGEHVHVLQCMLQSHLGGRHMLLQGPTGCGKTTLLREFATLLGYRTETMHLYADMTNKDLFQRRATDSATGNTTWENSALIEAARYGHIAVLDGVDKLPAGMVAALQELLVDGRTTLYDGTVLKPLSEYQLLKSKLGFDDHGMALRKVFPVHPAFRVIATAKPPSAATNAGSSGGPGSIGRFKLSSEVTSIFNVVQMPQTSVEATRAVLLQVGAREKAAVEAEQERLGVSASDSGSEEQMQYDVSRLLILQSALQELQETDPKIPQLSFRQMLHLVKYSARFGRGLSGAVQSSLLFSLLSSVTAQQVRQVMSDAGFHVPKIESDGETPAASADEAPVLALDERIAATLKSPSGNPVRVFSASGSPVLITERAYTESELALVPYVPHFFSNPVQESIITWLAKQYATGSNILLIGNQGVGKNKIVDSFLARVRVPRHYVQLHRDTTVGSLTINPTVEGGKVVWADSPLVKAVQSGHCLVIDEIDKAPVEVVQVLKGLIEDHEMRLGDGRRISGKLRSAELHEGGGDSDANVIRIHPDFRVVVLANPPGFPFHGNDFFRECGDLFVPYVIGNPDADSQLRVLKEYGPSLPDKLLVRLIAAFRRLQQSFQEGALTYPFSLRELIAVVRHMQKFPQDGVYESLNNVFNFDARDDATLMIVRQVLHSYLHPLVNAGGMRKLMPSHLSQQFPLKPLQQSIPFLLPAMQGTTAQAQPSAGAPIESRFLPVNPLEAFAHDEVVTVSVAREAHAESEFSVDADNGTNAYSEILGSVKLPFLLPDTDEVLSIMTHAADASIVSLLILRRPSKAQAPEILLCTCATPSFSSADTLLANTQARGVHWHVGDTQIINLSSSLPVSQIIADRSAGKKPRLFRFDATNHSEFMARGWPTSGALESVAAIADHRGNLLLVDVFVDNSSVAPPLSFANADEAEQHTRDDGTSPGTTSAQQQHQLKAEPAVLKLRFVEQESGSSEREVLLVDRGNEGTIASWKAHSSILYAWLHNHRVTITLPGKIHSVSFFAEDMATVTLELPGATQKITGIVKLSIHHEESGLEAEEEEQKGSAMPKSHSPRTHVKAHFTPLPNAFADGQFVDVVAVKQGKEGQQSASSAPATSGALVGDDLLGAVFVPHGANKDIAFMVVGSPLEDESGVTTTTTTSSSGTTSASRGAKSGLQFSMTAYQTPPIPSVEGGELGASHVSPGGVDAVRHQQLLHHGGHQMTVYDYNQKTYRTFNTSSGAGEPAEGAGSAVFHTEPQTGVSMTLEPKSQTLSSVDIDAERLESRYRAWSSLLDGSVNSVGAPAKAKDMNMEYSSPRKKPSGSLKHGKEDDKEHVGGNTWAGGTGGTDTAGLGGIIGPYRLDKGRPVHQVSPEEKKKIPPHIIEEARRMGREALMNRLDEIGMSAKEYQHYKSLQERVRGPIGQLRTVFGGLKAAEGERVWLKGQTDGVWDDGKIVEGIVGEKNIYKRRIDSKESSPLQAKHKKRLLFVLDVSASMFRFESMDQRLTKVIETTIMVMEAFIGLEEKIDYAMIGHNGDNHHIPLVDFGRPPANQKERMTVCQRMIAYSQYCWSGDNTVEAMRESLKLVTQEKGDAYFVFVISDANLRQYGITPTELSSIIRAKPEVKMFCIFIASFGVEASRIQSQLPPGRGFECLDTRALPQVLKQIFSSVNLL